MNHKRWLKKLSLFLDGELNETDKGKMESHLTNCPLCRQYYENWKKIQSVREQVSTIQPREEVWNHIIRNVRNETLKPLHIWEDDWLSRFIPNPVPAILTAIVVIFIVVVSQPYLQKQEAQTASMEQYLSGGIEISNGNSPDISYIIAGDIYEYGNDSNE